MASSLGDDHLPGAELSKDLEEPRGPEPATVVQGHGYAAFARRGPMQLGNLTLGWPGSTGQGFPEVPVRGKGICSLLGVAGHQAPAAG
jgi:hypothetical protein